MFASRSCVSPASRMLHCDCKPISCKLIHTNTQAQDIWSLVTKISFMKIHQKESTMLPLLPVTLLTLFPTDTHFFLPHPSSLFSKWRHFHLRDYSYWKARADRLTYQPSDSQFLSTNNQTHWHRLIFSLTVQWQQGLVTLLHKQQHITSVWL